MSITTKKGDKGKTLLYRGGMVKKDNIRIEILGTLDELCSFLGICKAVCDNKSVKNLLETIQKELFIIGSEVATLPKFINKLKNRIDKGDVRKLERKIRAWEAQGFFEERCFYLPGDNLFCAYLDATRAIARRAERRVAALGNRGGLKNRHALIYLNRLSDLLYLFARKFEKRHTKLQY